ncbi:MAG: hypothetical protein AB8G11_18025 [Saprospiraceae bacterium]
MNLYILVEGAETELQLYPKWFEYLLPQLSRVYAFTQVSKNSYYIFSGGGIPSIYNHAVNAIKDINSLGDKHDYFIVALDADEVSPQRRIEKVWERIEEAKIELNNNCQMEIIIHNRCVETWFLGNRKVYKRNPQGERFLAFSKHYNVEENNPELMEKMPKFATTAQFHETYLREMLNEYNIRYRKSRPNEVLKPYYLEELMKRVEDEPTHLESFSKFLELVKVIEEKIKTNA